MSHNMRCREVALTRSVATVLRTLFILDFPVTVGSIFQFRARTLAVLPVGTCRVVVFQRGDVACDDRKANIFFICRDLIHI